ncbi:reverse transcriptase domain-containing protein [Tanacetum coccineum]
MKIKEKLSEPWILFTDGSSCADGSGAGLILTSSEGMEFTYALRFGFEVTNNEAEYEALIVGLRIAEQMGIKSLRENVPRSKNKKADTLSKIASTSFAHLSKQVLVKELKEKSINEAKLLVIVEEEGETWMTPIHEYIPGGILPVVNGILFKKSFLGPWLRCVRPLQANYVLREIHKGSYSMHAGTRSVVSKAFQIGYYWPTMHKDARALIWACKDCQENRPIPRNPQQKLNPITSPWPFYKWGMTCRPFPKVPDFGLLGEIISDNGKQFRDNPFKDWCEKLCIRQRFASVKHPQTNGDLSRSMGTPHHDQVKQWRHSFFLTYGTKAVIPAEIGMPTLRTVEVDVVRNDEALEASNLDLLKERREQAAIREAKSKRKMEKYYNAKVYGISFKPGDLVYRNNDTSHVEQGGKAGSQMGRTI